MHGNAAIVNFLDRCKVLMRRLLKRIVKSDKKHKKLRYGDVTYKATGPKIAKIIHFSSSQNTKGAWLG